MKPGVSPGTYHKMNTVYVVVENQYDKIVGVYTSREDAINEFLDEALTEAMTNNDIPHFIYAERYPQYIMKDLELPLEEQIYPCNTKLEIISGIITYLITECISGTYSIKTAHIKTRPTKRRSAAKQRKSELLAISPQSEETLKLLSTKYNLI